MANGIASSRQLLGRLLTATMLLALAAQPAIAAENANDSAAAPAAAASDAARSRCDTLRAVTVADIHVTATTAIVPSPRWETPPMAGRRGGAVTRAFCRVEGVIDGRVGFELWLPDLARWNGRLLGAGVGGDAGYYNYTDLARGVDAGYAAITNDSGHKYTEAHWMMRPEAVADYTHRAQHLMNQAGRALVTAYYGTGAHHAYFIGCSGGGRQALKEMQRYPQDYDGVIAGAGAPTMPVMSARHLWQALYQQKHPEGVLDDAHWDLVAKAAVQSCDARDGVADGVVENPAQCHPKLAALRCRKGPASDCLTDAQLETVKRFYAPLRDESGAQLDNGLMAGVRTRPGPPSPLLLPFFAEGAHHDLAWRAEQFNIRDDLALARREMPEMQADVTSLGAFGARGGRAILYQGWMDPSVVANQSIDYVERVRQDMGNSWTDEHMRLYMVPGMLHCRGGDGVDQFGGSADPRPIGDASNDLLTALTQWVEAGRAPTRIQAVRSEAGTVTRRRVLCPYPQSASFLGGDSNDPSRYQCR